jgi:hypothetical protein
MPRFRIPVPVPGKKKGRDRDDIRTVTSPTKKKNPKMTDPHEVKRQTRRENLVKRQTRRKNLYKADAVHDFGQDRQRGNDDESTKILRTHCRMALSDMLAEKETPTKYVINPDIRKRNCTRDIKAQTNKLNILLIKISEGAVKSTSKYEETYFEAMFPEIEEISFQDIIREKRIWNKEKKQTERPIGWLKYIGFRNNDVMEREIEMNPELRKYAVLTQDPNDLYNKNRCLKITWNTNDYDETISEWGQFKEVADFILKWLNPGTKGISEKGVFVFDMGSSFIGQLYSLIQELSSEMNPMVVSDSANTITCQLGTKGHERNTFCFPEKNSTGIEEKKQKRFLVDANKHTSSFEPNLNFKSEFYYIKHENIDYDKKTFQNFNFYIAIYHKKFGEWVKIYGLEFEFKKNKFSSGASVLHLSCVIVGIRQWYWKNFFRKGKYKYGIFTDVPSTKSTIMSFNDKDINNMIDILISEGMPIGQVCLWVERLCFDIKKCGDWEQINSIERSLETCKDTIGTAMLCTGDRLCAGQGIIAGVNGIWHSRLS